MDDPNAWPPLPIDEWEYTRATLHMWTQIVGKVRLALSPPVNHWWQVPLYVSPRGLTTSADGLWQGKRSRWNSTSRAINWPSGKPAGRKLSCALYARSVADFYQRIDGRARTPWELT